jgi:hypothetical protein
VLRLLVVAGVLGGLAGCSGATTDGSAGPSGSAGPVHAPAVHLTATLVSPVHIALKWTDSGPGVAERSIEYATDARGPYTVLDFVPPAQTTYDHRDLMPRTAFYYRVRPLFGPASAPVSVTLPPGGFDENAQAPDAEWAKPKVNSPVDGPVAAASIRDPGTVSAATPTGLKATVKDANGILFTWADHASDEEGYLLEVKPDGSPDFGVVAVFDPNVNSAGLVTLPTEKQASYRVRAFYYGQPSNVVEQATGQGPE